ncbi:MAG: hypothetical protein R3B45_06785 [Bdellovibrionota bacterium]
MKEKIIDVIIFIFLSHIFAVNTDVFASNPNIDPKIEFNTVIQRNENSPKINCDSIYEDLKSMERYINDCQKELSTNHSSPICTFLKNKLSRLLIHRHENSNDLGISDNYQEYSLHRIRINSINSSTKENISLKIPRQNSLRGINPAIVSETTNIKFTKDSYSYRFLNLLKNDYKTKISIQNDGHEIKISSSNRLSSCDLEKSFAQIQSDIEIHKNIFSLESNDSIETYWNLLVRMKETSISIEDDKIKAIWIGFLLGRFLQNKGLNHQDSLIQERIIKLYTFITDDDIKLRLYKDKESFFKALNSINNTPIGLIKNGVINVSYAK